MTKSQHLDRSNPYGEPCHFCNGKNHPYMIQWELWRKVFPNEKTRWFATFNGVIHHSDKIICCIPCFEKKLGRELVESDFLDAPINRGIFGFDAKTYCEAKREQTAA